jgi:hypothetical protein
MQIVFSLTSNVIKYNLQLEVHRNKYFNNLNQTKLSKIITDKISVHLVPNKTTFID